MDIRNEKVSAPGKRTCYGIVPNTESDSESRLHQSTEVIDLTTPVTFSSLLVVDLTHLTDDPVNKNRSRSTSLEAIFALSDVEFMSGTDCPSDKAGVETHENDVIIDLTEESTEPASQDVRLPDTIQHMDPLSSDTEQEESNNRFVSETLLDSGMETDETDSNDVMLDMTDGVTELTSPAVRWPNIIQPIDQEESEDSYESANDTIVRLNALFSFWCNEIARLETAEVDFSNENSNFILLEAYKMKVCEIDAEINRLVGKTAEVPAKTMTTLDVTRFTEFNRMLEEMVNGDAELPCTSDALKCLKLCNRKYRYQLSEDDCYEIVEEAFREVGLQLQKQRNFELNEMFSYYTKDTIDPALNDFELQLKLDRNRNERNSFKE